MASKAILHDGPSLSAARWLRESRRRAPADLRGAVVSFVHRLSPTACRAMLRRWSGGETDPRAIPPFVDLEAELRADWAGPGRVPVNVTVPHEART
jgi:hypothetical protein